MEKNNISVRFNWSIGVLLITIVSMMAIAGGAIYIETINWPSVMLWLKYLLRMVFLFTVIGAVGYMPIRLRANDEKISLKRLFNPIEVPLNEVIEITQIPKSYIAGSIRTFGSGGAFGFLGRFKNKRLGKYTMYATDLKKLILIRTGDKTYLFSCARPRELVGMLEKCYQVVH